MKELRVSLKLPKEHGAWAMLYVPFLLGVLVAGTLSWRVVLLLLSVTFLFVARESLVTWYRRGRQGRKANLAHTLMLAYLGLAALFGAPLLFHDQFFGLIPIAVLAIILLAINTRRAGRWEDRTVWGEFLAVVGLTLTAPAAHYVARGAWESTALWLWALSALYFTSSVFYVRLRVFAVHPRREQIKQQLRRRCAFYHAFSLAALLAFILTDSLNLLALIAFGPMLARAAWFLLKPAGQLNLRRVGLLEILYSLIFLVFIALSFHLA